MCVFGCIAYTMMPNEKRSKLNAKGTKWLFIDYCKGTKIYRFMYMEKKEDHQELRCGVHGR